MKLIGGIALVLATLTLAACGGSSSDSNSDSTSESTTTEQPAKKEQEGTGGADGKTVFADNCASCHTLAAADATGTVGPDLDSTKPAEGRVKTMVEDGGAAMPAFAGQLSDDEISAVSSFVAENAGQ